MPTTADGLTVLAVLSAAVGYAEGARLAPVLGADQVICRARLQGLPLLLPFLFVDVVSATPTADAAGWSSFACTAAVSMFLCLFAWYRGLALGGVAKVSQVQLAQPLLTAAASVILFGQRLDPAVLLAAVAVLACVAAAQRTRVTAARQQAGREIGPNGRRDPARTSQCPSSCCLGVVTRPTGSVVDARAAPRRDRAT